jgi:hypothetical protein
MSNDDVRWIMKNVLGKVIGFVVMAGLLLPTVCRAQVSDVEALQYVGGTIPIIRKIEVSGAGYSDFFSTITAIDYTEGFKASNAGLTTLTVTANDKWKVLVRATLFTQVEDYIKPVSDLLLKIKDKTVVNEDEGNAGNFNNTFIDFAPLREQDQVLWSNTDSGDNGCTAKIDFKVLLNAAKDMPGTYTTTVTYTISAP